MRCPCTASIQTRKDDSHEDRLPATLVHTLASQSRLAESLIVVAGGDRLNVVADVGGIGAVLSPDLVFGVTGVLANHADDVGDSAFICCIISVSKVTCSRSLLISSSRSLTLVC